MTTNKVYYRLIFDLLFSKPLCLLCGLPCSPGSQICTGCKTDLPWLQDHCIRCAEPLPKTSTELLKPDEARRKQTNQSRINSQKICGRCQKDPPAFDRTLAPFQYEEPIKQLIATLKNKGRLDIIELAAELFTEHLRDRITQQPPQLIVPVPLHRNRLYSRGYNQAAEWAERLSEKLDIPYDKRSCRRLINTPHQQGLSAAARRKNLRHCFHITSPLGVERVAIVDDVMTTGSTVNALAHKLKDAGVTHVEIWCFARTPAR
ncbi:ComF family protein [Motiliproteus sp. MSK22-1]|uniref:ComF family protein n=1 Tax=Motiliproteus sp. MSK22-1 TaxID=1897630 RepID=UPI000978AEAB|nr:ComF family protein [Motiliproteus sp. MSK22-1]OMH38223.1 hypothetical protein BGP75_08200 [Motiliproteus sp. MSK22-1]